jgi:uncharacterized damage-inducible protein DinB
MTRFAVRPLTGAVAVAAALLAGPAAAQQTATTTAAAQPVTVQSALANDVATLSDKFSGLARVMAGKYDWRPGQGVRSVSEVFNLIVAENKMLTALLTGAQGGGRGNAINDPAELQDALKNSYAALKTAVAGLSDADLKTPVKMFGRDMTKQSAALLLIMDQHEHLGQSIAYARSNGVVPPWSK